MAVEEACSGWCCKNLVWLLTFSDNSVVKTDSSRQLNDLSFHHMHFSYAMFEGSYSVLNLSHVGISHKLLFT